MTLNELPGHEPDYARYYCTDCHVSWRGGGPCFCCDQPGQPGHKGSEPKGWPRVTVTPGAVLPGRREA